MYNLLRVIKKLLALNSCFCRQKSSNLFIVVAALPGRPFRVKPDVMDPRHSHRGQPDPEGRGVIAKQVLRLDIELLLASTVVVHGGKMWYDMRGKSNYDCPITTSQMHVRNISC